MSSGSPASSAAFRIQFFPWPRFQSSACGSRRRHEPHGGAAARPRPPRETRGGAATRQVDRHEPRGDAAARPRPPRETRGGAATRLTPPRGFRLRSPRPATSSGRFALRPIWPRPRNRSAAPALAAPSRRRPWATCAQSNQVITLRRGSSLDGPIDALSTASRPRRRGAAAAASRCPRTATSHRLPPGGERERELRVDEDGRADGDGTKQRSSRRVLRR